MNSPTINLTFPHRWQARILPARPLILPQRNFVYPAQAEEVERGALEILITFEPSHSQEKHSPSAQEFLATCALGFADPTRPAKDNVWIDWVSGAVVRQGLPVKVRKV